MLSDSEQERNYIDCLAVRSIINKVFLQQFNIKGFDLQVLCLIDSTTYRLRRNTLTASDLILYSGSIPIHIYESIERLQLGDENAPLKLVPIPNAKARHYELTAKGIKIVKYAARLAADYSKQLDLLKNEDSDISF